ncbi:MAG TPA: tRNA pseudouridine(38-40) synthase TruA [Terriglobia bacterium]|jgi:tRNA pseudouridine38-40 synthase|nr:tRNA pseudouridine(38-40) synthase TruA [Terriglobia bacterium]
MRNIRLLIAYDGADFHGWQRQPHARSIQEELEAKIAQITGSRVALHASGRTDAGVHASGQVANFRTECPIPCEGLAKALNDVLPPAIRVRHAEDVPSSFHARYRAKSKTYRYRILQTAICPPFLARYVYHHPYPLDWCRMAKAARLFEGEHDFTSFAGDDHSEETIRKDSENSNVRRIFSSRLELREKLALLVYEVRGSGFLHHMVRNIVGTLLEVGSGKRSPEDIPAILEARDRSKAGPTAPANGLCLVKVEY